MCVYETIKGSFGRFSLALLLTAGKYSRIHFAYSDDILIDSNFRVPKPSVLDGSRAAAGIVFFDKIAFIRHLSVVFTVDLFQDSSTSTSSSIYTHTHAKKDLFRHSSTGEILLPLIHTYIYRFITSILHIIITHTYIPT